MLRIGRHSDRFCPPIVQIDLTGHQIGLTGHQIDLTGHQIDRICQIDLTGHPIDRIYQIGHPIDRICPNRRQIGLSRRQICRATAGFA